MGTRSAFLVVSLLLCLMGAAALAAQDTLDARLLLYGQTCGGDPESAVLVGVVQQDGEGQAGSRIVLFWHDVVGEVHRQRTVAGAHGEFRFCQPPADVRLFTRAVLGGWTSAVADLGIVRPGIARHDLVLVAATATAVAGRVVAHADGMPVGDARVGVAGTELQQITDADGTFRFVDVPVGRQTLEVRHLAYGDHSHALDVGAGADTAVLIRVTVEAIALEPITVVARPRYRTPGLAEFHERVKSGHGQFITRADFDRVRPSRFSDMLRGVPGLQIICELTRCMVQFQRNRRVRGDCKVQIFVDGTPYDPETIDFLRPEEIEGVEIYSGPSDVPVRFARGGSNATRCGVVAIWLRERLGG
jgi:hypothetical protein